MADNEEEIHQHGDSQQRVIPVRYYMKDASFEAPNTPDIFKSAWKPRLELEIDNTSSEIEGDTYEIILTISVKAVIDEQTAYMAEVHQAGIFVLSGFDSDELQLIIYTQCLRLMYPYAIAALASFVNKGDFPQLLLRPVNFRALYEQRFQNKQENEGSTSSSQNA